MTTYFTVQRVRGRAWNPARPLRAQARWAEHAAFMDALVAGKFVVLGGPVGDDPDDGAEILLVVRAPDEDAVRERLAHDPWDAADLLRVERVARWTILLDDREAERGAS